MNLFQKAIGYLARSIGLTDPRLVQAFIHAARATEVTVVDLLVELGAGRRLVVDAKVPLGALLEAEAASDEALRAELFARHARDVAQHAERLGSKEYWRRDDDTLEAVVLFLPAESILGIALREDPALLERSFSRGVILATPTTLLALLRTVSHVWRREAIADNAREIHALGRELYERLGVTLDHVRRMGSSLDAAVSHYNRLVGSLDGRVRVSARRLAEHGSHDALLAANGEYARMWQLQQKQHN